MKRRTNLASFFTYLVGGGVVVFGATAFLSGMAAAESYQTTESLNFTFNPTVNITVSGDLVINGLSPSNSSDSNQITVTAASNSLAGYTLGSTVGSSSSDYTDLRISSSNTSNVFSNLTTNKASLANFSDSNWGYSYSTDSGSTWKSGDITGTPLSGYNGLPKYDGTAVKLINATAPGSSSVMFKIGAKAASTQAAGTYTNTINFIGVSKVVTTAYMINYNDPSGEATNMPAAQTGSTTTGAVQISSTVPYRSGYTFKGWCTTSTTDATCSGTTVQPGGFLALNTTSASITKPLYAMWQSNSAGPTVIGTMQDVGTWGSSLSAGDEVVATDARDGKAYYVTKFSNGEIWMTQNLDHDISSSYEYNSSNTDVSDYPTLNSTYTTGDTTWDWSTTTPESYDPGDLCWNGTLDSNWSTDLSTGTISCSAPNHYHIGNYYNWTAAIAMEDSSMYDYEYDGTDVEQSICPAGWRLPTYSGSKSYLNLKNTLSLTAGTSGNIQNTPVYFVYGGYWRGSSGVVGSYGYYWSSVVFDDYYAYYLYFDVDGYLNPQDYGYRGIGSSVRCVAR